MTLAEREELAALRRYDELCSLGDRPMSPSVAKLCRLTVLEAMERDSRNDERIRPMSPDRIALDLTAPTAWHAALRASGPDLTEFAHLKIAHEAQELAAEPEHLIELADVLICAAALMLRNGWTAEQVNAAIEQKTAINKARTWERMPDGTWQHRK